MSHASGPALHSSAVPAAVSVRPADSPSGVALDETLGTAKLIPFAGNTCTITPSLGQQAGGNLFYSFSAFSLVAGQTASFTGTPASPVQNVLVRVTGSQSSTIDGTLACTYPNAALFS